MAVQFAVQHSRTSEYRFWPEDITIDPNLNGRHNTPDIEWLVTDILARGQATPVVIRKDGPNAVLVAGFSRWRAISEINRLGLSPVKIQIRCTYVQCTEAEAFLINISENRFRNPTTPIDDAHNIKRLLNVYAMTEDQIAEFYFPTAKTEPELKAARKFVKDRVDLIPLSSASAAAVRSGRVTPTAAVAIARLSEAQQREVLERNEGKIERKDVAPPALKPKPTGRDPELLRRSWLVLEDVSGILMDDDCPEFVEVERKLLRDFHGYVMAQREVAQ